MDIKDLAILRPIIIAVVAFGIVAFLLRKNSSLSKRMHRRYLLRLVLLAIIFACIFDAFRIMDPSLRINNILLKGSALIVAILGFAAQEAISDIISGLLISIHKPFEIGDRIVVEGQDPGVVEDITLRHTVLRVYDDIRIVVPNSVLNSKVVTNTSYKRTDRRGIHLQYSVAYDTDVHRAMDIIRDCVVESPYTLSVENNGIIEDSGPVYFLKFAESALMLDTTIWVTRATSTYVATTDVNLRVNEAFKQNGIEIPYNYLNVVSYEGSKGDAESKKEVTKNKTQPSRRHYRTNTIRLAADNSNIDDAIKTAQRFARKQNIGEHETMQLELLCEESIGIVGTMVDDVKTEFWIEGSGYKYRIHLRFDAKIGSKEYQKLINLSSAGKNEAVKGFAGRIWEVVVMGLDSNNANKGSGESFEWQLSNNRINEEEIGESILAAVASDVKVSITGERVEFLVIKTNKA